MFGKPKSCPLEEATRTAREANASAADELRAAVDRVLAGSRGTVAVFEAIDLANRRKAAGQA